MGKRHGGFSHKGLQKDMKWNDVGVRNACGLLAYQSRGAARHQQKRMNKPKIRAFRCWRCNLFHVGELPSEVVAGKMTADAYFKEAARGANRRSRSRGGSLAHSDHGSGT